MTPQGQTYSLKGVRVWGLRVQFLGGCIEVHIGQYGIGVRGILDYSSHVLRPKPYVPPGVAEFKYDLSQHYG